MTNRIDHKDCLHEATSKDRAACRKARASQDAAHEVLIQALLDAMPENDGLGYDWLMRGASIFGGYAGHEVLKTPITRREAAEALLSYFGPSGDEDRDARRRANGYTVTTSASQIRSIILRRCS